MPGKLEKHFLSQLINTFISNLYPVNTSRTDSEWMNASFKSGLAVASD